MNKTNSFRKTIIIASLIFGMLFGAGNLIFPVHLGQLAGKNWLAASSGFLISSGLLPLMALIAISITHSHGIFELAKPIGKKYALQACAEILLSGNTYISVASVVACNQLTL